MGFRDDRIAAHARAEALARRLVERERELAALRAALDEAERRAAAAQQADDERPRADEARDAARAKLEAAAERAAAPPPTSPRARADTADLEERERARRIDRSLSLLGSMSWEVTLFVAVAVIGFFAVAIHETYGDLLAAGFFAAGAGPVIALKLLAPRWCQYLYRREHSWARARGIDGYPELLVTTPDEHQHIVVRL